MEISQINKVEVLIALYQTRISSMDQIRNRGYQMILWMSGIFAFVLGILSKSSIDINVSHRVGLIAMLICTYVVILHQLNILRSGFLKHRDILIKIENSLKLYDKGVYCEEALYPAGWQ